MCQAREASPRPSSLVTTNQVPHPHVRLIPATPVDPVLTQANCLPDTELTSELGLSSSTTNTTSILSNASMSRTSSAKSRRSTGSSIRTEKKGRKSTSFCNLRKYSFKSVSSEKETKSSERSQSSKLSRRSIRLLKKKSMREDSEEQIQECNSEGNIRKLATKKNSFYKVLDRLRGLSRRSSVLSGAGSQSGGQSEFLASISGMSDSRIVENWLLSIDDEQISEPPPLESLAVPESRLDQLTPTNETIDTERKAVDGHKLAYISSDDSSVADIFEEKESFDRRRSMFRPVGLGRQVSESSEYTTDTHDTGELAQETALNTIRNTSNLFTSCGDEIKKITLSPASAGSGFRTLVSSTAEAESCQGSDTPRTLSSVTKPLPAMGSSSSDVQGRGVRVVIIELTSTTITRDLGGSSSHSLY